MSFGLHAVAAGAAAVLMAGAGVASAQPYYGYGELPPAPYQVEGGGGGYYGGGGNCGGDRFTLLGAHAGVTVLGVDLGAGAGLSVPTDYCGGQGEGFEPRPYAPPPPAPAAYGPPAYAYAPPAYAYQSYAAQSYGPPMAPPPAYPCGCEAPRW